MTNRFDLNLYNSYDNKVYIVFAYEKAEGGAHDFDSYHSNIIQAIDRLTRRIKSNESMKGHILDMQTKQIITINQLECTFEDKILRELKGSKRLTVPFLVRKYKINSTLAKEILEKFREKNPDVIIPDN